MAIDIRKALKKMLPHLLQAQAENLNEADTVLRLIKFCEDVLGYDSMTEISREAEMKKQYVDIVLKVDGTIRLLLEAKAGGETLRDRHIDQAQAYAAKNNYRWVILTNGVVWTLYHLTFEEGIEFDIAFTVNLGDPETFDRSVECLTLLHKQSIKKGELEAYWKKATALSPVSVARALFHESVLGILSREIRREEGLRVDQEDLANALHGMFSPEARELIGPVRIRRKRVARKAKPGAPPDELAADGGEAEPAVENEKEPEGAK